MDKPKKSLILLSKKLSNILGIEDDFGNASIKIENSMLIKASGSNLSKLTGEDIAKVSLKISKGKLCPRPSSDTPTHRVLYNEFPGIGAIVHTHSPYATSWAQSGLPIPCLGTTHADYWSGEIPITRSLTDKEINGEYESETGKVIIEKIKELNVDPLDCPGILVANHGSFTWGKTVEDAVKHAELLEYIARLAWLSLSINSDAKAISKVLHNKHYSRKHGPGSYYGQTNE